MRCPNCSKNVADGTAICPSCDHILDASFLGDVPDDLNAEDGDGGDADEASTQAPPPSRGSAPKPTVAARPAVRPPAPGSRPLPEEDATAAAGMPGPPGEEEATNTGPTPADARPRPASQPPRGTTGRRPASRFAEPSRTEDEMEAPATARELPADRQVTAAQPSVEERINRNSRPSLKVAPPQQKAGNKYVSAAAGRESESTRAQGAGNLPPAAAPPPVDPEAVFRHLWHAVLDMALEDKIELLAAVGAALMLFMPWRTFKGDDDIGLVTWGGFWTLLFVGGAMGLFYLRHTHRIPTLTPKLLTLGELVVSGIALPVDLLFIFTSIDRTKVRGIAGDTWKSVPAPGSIMGLLCVAGVVLGAALCWNKHRNDAQ